MIRSNTLGRSVWKPAVSIAASLLAVVSQVDAQPLSDSNTLKNFMRGAKPTPECVTDTIQNLETRMSVSGPYSVDEFERTVRHFSVARDGSKERVPVYHQVSESVKERITEADRIFAFSFHTDPTSENFWGYSGYLVARDGCIMHVEVTSYDN